MYIHFLLVRMTGNTGQSKGGKYKRLVETYQEYEADLHEQNDFSFLKLMWIL